MRLADVIAAAVADERAPAAALALAYAERIDASSHVALGLADALDKLQRAAQLADESGTADKPSDENMKAFRKVAAALSAVTVASDLGPKLLAALDALLLTPKARAAVHGAMPPAVPAGSRLSRLRNQDAARHLRAV